MSIKQPVLSICIPSYNRPKELYRLLKSIDAKITDKLEIVIREDYSPRRNEVREKVETFRKESMYSIVYIENPENYGYDKNIRMCGKVATGIWVIYMGDDDIFSQGALDDYIGFLEKNSQLGFVLRRYQKNWDNGVCEDFRYSKKDEFFCAGEKTIVEFFRRCVSICGFTYRKECFNDYDNMDLDGTLLFQTYIEATVCLFFKSAYCDIPIATTLEGAIPYFGSSNNEKDLYESGKNTYKNSINFLKQTRYLTEYFDRMYHTHITEDVIKSYSKYSYGYLFEHRNDGVRVFRKYANEIRKIGMGKSIYFFIYYYALLIFGTKNCQKGIRVIKNILGKTPRL